MEHFYTRFKSLQHRKGSNFLVLLLIAVLQVLFSQQLFAQVARIQVVNFSTTIGTFDLYANDLKVVEDLSLHTGTSLLEVSGGVISLVATPGAATSISEGIALADYSLVSDGKYIVVLYDAVENGVITPSFTLLDNSNVFSGDPANAEVAFSHVAPEVPAIDIVLRSGGMIVGNLGYGTTTYNVPLPTIDNFLDVKSSGTTNILGTYRLSLQGYEGRSAHVLMTGFVQNNNTLKFFSLDDSGYLAPVDAAPVSRVQYINALAPAVDIFKNGSRFADDVAQGQAMLYKYIPAGIDMTIGIAPANSSSSGASWSNTTFVFENMVTYTAVSAGEINTPIMLLASGAKEKATANNVVEVRCFNADHLNTNWSVTRPDNSLLFDEVAYAAASAFKEFTPDSVAFRLMSSNTGSPIFQTTSIDLSQDTNQALTLLIAPALSGIATDPPQVWLVDAEGNSKTIYYQTSSTQYVQAESGISISPNPVHEWLHINTPEHQTELAFSIFDLQGRLVKQGILTDTQLDVSDLNSGLHCIIFYKNNNSITNHTLKFIKWNN